MISIRAAIPDELEEIRKVAIESYHATFAADNTPENMELFYNTVYTRDNFINEYHETGSKLLIAAEGENILGFSRLRESAEVESILGKNTIELQRLYVHPNSQGRSVGKSLMLASIEFAKDKNYDWIWLGVWEKNFKAQKFYTNLGFEKFSEHTFWQGNDPQIDWLLKLKL